MNLNELTAAAHELTSELKQLTAHKLYVCAHAYKAESNHPNRIVVEGIKNLRTTGRFTSKDRLLINAKLFDFCSKHELKIKVLDTDYGMHNAIMTCK